MASLSNAADEGCDCCCMHALMLLSVAIDGTAGGASGANIEVNE